MEEWITKHKPLIKECLSNAKKQLKLHATDIRKFYPSTKNLEATTHTVKRRYKRKTTNPQPLLKQQKMAHIVNVSSVFGLFTTPYNGIYSASKFAVNGFTDALAQELRKTHINVSCAFPAGIKTDIAKSARIVADLDNNRSAKDLQTTIEKLFWTSAEQAAAEILKGVTKNKQRILVGKGATLMDIIRRLLPVNYSLFLKI